jgi:hypothetical protein
MHEGIGMHEEIEMQEETELNIYQPRTELILWANTEATNTIDDLQQSQQLDNKSPRWEADLEGDQFVPRYGITPNSNSDTDSPNKNLELSTTYNKINKDNDKGSDLESLIIKSSYSDDSKSECCCVIL